MSAACCQRTLTTPSTRTVKSGAPSSHRFSLPVMASVRHSGFLGVSFGQPSSTSVVAVKFGLERFVYLQPCVCVMRGVASGVLVWLRCAAHDASREFSVKVKSGALFGLFCPWQFDFIVFLGLTWRSKGRAASWRFCSFVVYQALGLRSPSVGGTPLSSTLELK